MKIVCLTASLRLGGAERQLLGLAGVLRDAGHDVEVLAYHPDVFYSDTLSNGDLRYCLIEKGRGGTLGLCRKIAAHLEETGCEALIAFLPGACTKACIIHKMSPKFRLIVSERNFSIKIRLHEYLRFFLFREADKVVCNNYSQEKLISKKVPWLRDKLLTINNFVDLQEFTPKSLGPSGPHPLRIVVTARLCRRKNAVGLIKAAALLKDAGAPEFTVDWYGSENNGRYASRCRCLIRKYGLEDIFRIHPAAKNAAAVYQAADVFCLPSFYEGTSNSLAEALACGKIAAVSNVGDNSLYVRENVNGVLFNPGNHRDIASSLARILSCDSVCADSFCAASRAVSETLLNRYDFSKKWLASLKY